MSLRRLDYFVVLAEELHFSRAAARLHLAQPALSQQIRRLEDDVRLSLFDRSRRRVELTQAGALLLVEARRVLQAARLNAVAAHARVLERVDQQSEEMLAFLADLVRMPSVGGTDGENSAQSHLAPVFENEDLEVDYWQIPLDSMLTASDFAGMEVDRTEAWGLVGRLPGRCGAPTLMLNGHIDVVPVGDLDSWSDQDPFSGLLSAGQLYGRGACDMKGGLVAALWAVRACAAAGCRYAVTLYWQASKARRTAAWAATPFCTGAGAPTRA